MELRWTIKWLILASSCLVLTIAIPASLIDEIKANELKTSKVKRAYPLNNPEHVIHETNQQYYSKPTAIKRGANLNKNMDQQSNLNNEWNESDNNNNNNDQQINYPLNNIQSTLYNSDDNQFDDKSIAEYEKGFHYGTNKEKLDEALENAVLKSELYGEPASINQYRYYGRDDRRRKRREIQNKLRMDNRNKRDVDLTPEEILTILTLYENEQRRNEGYNKPTSSNWQQRFESQDNDDEDDENWLDTPVYPHSTNDIGPNYIFDDNKYEKRNGYWGNYADNRKKRFMIAKKRNDPTRELRYLNGPNQNDFYTLSQLLSNQREPNVPLYHRLVL